MLPCHSVQSVMSGPVPRRLGPHSEHVCSRYPLFIYSTCFWVLGPRFPQSPPSWSCYPVRTLIAVCCVVSTLLGCLKHRRHRIVMQSLCFAKGARATWVLSFTIRYFQESSNRNWCVWRDSNPDPERLEPKSSAATNYATDALFQVV